VKPAAERPRLAPRPTAPADEPLRPGELACQSCGTGNDATRRFCRRCGTPLVAQVEAPHRKAWWRRFIGGGGQREPRERARKGTLAAGERPASMRKGAGRSVGGALKTLIPLLVVVVVAGAVTGYVMVPSVHQGIDKLVTQVRRTVAPTYVPVNTAGKAVGSAGTGHPALAAFDGFSNTYWAAPPGAKAPTLSASFSPAVDIAKVLITAGASGDFQALPRPKSLLLEFLDASGQVIASKTTQLTDTKDPQVIDVAASGVSGVRLTVQAIYQGAGTGGVAITEIEFRAVQ